MGKLKDIIAIKKGTKVEPSDFLENTIRFIQIDDLRNNNNIKYCEIDNNYTFVNENDVIIAWDGANAGTIGYGLNGAIGSTLARLRIVNNEIYPKYLGIMLKGKFEYLRETCTGATIPHISKSALENIEIPLLRIEEQKKIARFIEKVSNLICIRESQIEKLDLLIKSQFVKMFGNMKNYPKVSFIECTNFIDYRGKTPKLSDNGTIKMINAKSVGKGFFKDINEYVTQETYDNWMTRGFPKPGDVLFVTEGHTFGNVCRIPEYLKKFAMGQRVITIQGNEKIVTNEFLATYMQFDEFKDVINKYKTGSSAQGIRSKELVTIKIPIPNIAKQNQFALFIKQIDKQKIALQKNLNELNILYNALMQKYFG